MAHYGIAGTFSFCLFIRLYVATIPTRDEFILDNNEKILENRHWRWQFYPKSNQNYQKKKLLALWQRCPDDYFLRNSPKQIAWHTELLAEFDGEVLVKISNRFSNGGTEIFVIVPIKLNLFNKVVSTIGAKKFSIHDAQILTSMMATYSTTLSSQN